MSVINLLHISDSHIEKKSENEIREIVSALCQDVIKIQKEKNITIDAVCFSGDLIQRGSEACTGENQWVLAHEILITPLLEVLKLKNDDFIIVPGNHETI